MEGENTGEAGGERRSAPAGSGVILPASASLSRERRALLVLGKSALTLLLPRSAGIRRGPQSASPPGCARPAKRRRTPRF